MHTRAYLLAGSLVVGLSCAKGKPTAFLSDASGVEKGTRVFAEGVSVGLVERLEVEEGRVRVTLDFTEGHSVALRADACAVVLPGIKPSVVIFPGKDLEPRQPPIPACRDDASLRARVRALTLTSNAPLAASAQTFLLTHRELEQPSEPCGALEVSKLRVERVEAMPVVLPTGGRRVWLSLENRSDAPLALSTARFVDAKGIEAPHAHVSLDETLFEAFNLAPRTRKEVSAVFDDSREVSAVEFEAQMPNAPGGSCRSRWPF